MPSLQKVRIPVRFGEKAFELRAMRLRARDEITFANHQGLASARTAS